MFHNDAKVLTRLDRIEASQVSTEGIVAEFRDMLKSLEKELCDTIAGCVATLKCASGDSRHDLGCSEGLAQASLCCTKCKTRCGISVSRRVCSGGFTAKQINSTRHRCCCIQPDGTFQGSGSSVDNPGEWMPESTTVITCSTSCEEQILSNNCTQTAPNDHIRSVQQMHGKKEVDSAWEVISTLRSMGTLCEAEILAHQVQDQDSAAQNLTLSASSAHLPRGSGPAEEIVYSNARAQLEQDNSIRSIPDHGCGSTAFKTGRLDGTVAQAQVLAQQSVLLQASTNLSSHNVESCPESSKHSAASDCCQPGEWGEGAAFLFLEQTPPSTPRSGSSQSWSPSMRRMQASP
jgi:hypothetical protein